MPFQPLDRDQPNVIMMCRNCQACWHIYQQQVGLPVPCPSCHGVGYARYWGTAGGGQGRQLSFGSFGRLLGDPHTSAGFLRLVERLLNVRQTGKLRFVDGSGNAVPLEEVHDRLQGEEASQDAVYNRAMDVIR